MGAADIIPISQMEKQLTRAAPTLVPDPNCLFIMCSHGSVSPKPPPARTM